LKTIGRKKFVILSWGREETVNYYFYQNKGKNKIRVGLAKFSKLAMSYNAFRISFSGN